MAALPTLTRKRVLWWTGIASTVSYFGYNYYTKRQTRQRHIELAQKIALEPLAVDKLPRKIFCYISATTIDDGYALKRGFETLVKPIWDAAALDYEVVEGWQWFDDVATRVAKNMAENSPSAAAENDRKAAEEMPQFKFSVSRDEVGYVGFGGRASLKGVVKGAEQFLESLPAGEQTQDKVIQPTGYVPYSIPRWWRKLLYYFNDRHYVKSVGDAALAVAMGDSVQLSKLFPGSLQFSIDETEFKKEKKSSDEAKEKTDEEVAVKDSKPAVGDVFLVKEQTMETIRIFYDSGKYFSFVPVEPALDPTKSPE